MTGAVMLMMLVGGLGHTLICWVALQLDFFRGGTEAFHTFFLIVWAGHLTLITAAALGLERYLPSRDLVLPVVLWSTLVLVVSTYFVNHVRLCVMMTLFAVLQVGVFRMRTRSLAVVSTLGVLGYSVVILLVHGLHPVGINLVEALTRWATFALMTVAFVILAAEISGIRGRLAERNRELAVIVDKIQDMAIKDELTGLYNRRHAMERLHKVREMANRGAFDFVVVYLDLDHFKHVNDYFGHHTGDEVLRVLANTVRHQITERDFCARLGGEEFLLTLVKADLDDAERLAHGLRQALAEARIDSAPSLRITASMGLARFASGESLEALLARADAGLYQAKREGRDRVVRAPEAHA